MGITLTDEEADYLIKVEKLCLETKEFKFPFNGGKVVIPLVSKDKKEEFLLDINRASIDINKNTFQNRVRKCIKLVRLDLGGAPHRNPDGKEIGTPHIHIYKNGYEDKFAYELPEFFLTCKTIKDYFYKFLEYCNVTKKTNIEMGLFV